MVAKASWAGSQKKSSSVSRPSGIRRIAAPLSATSGATGGIEEMFVQNPTVSLCLLVNRRARTMRVIDFRAGPSQAKRTFVLDLARKEGIEKVYTLVERDEVGTWIKLGFAKEANIPGFYKRSDAYLLGTTVDDAHFSVGDIEVDNEDDEVLVEKASPAHDLAEKTLVQAKKQVKLLQDRALPAVKVAEVGQPAIQKTLDKTLRGGTALTAVEKFGRDVVRRWFTLSARNGFELVASTESQSCFGNAFIEILQAPTTEHEKLATISALRGLCDKLLAEGVVSAFAVAPSDDLALATAFVFNGFRRTGLLVNHLLVGGVRKDAIVWSRKLATPTEG